MPHSLSLGLIGVVLLLAGLFLAPLVPVAGTFLKLALCIVGAVVIVWALIVLVRELSRR